MTHIRGSQVIGHCSFCRGQIDKLPANATVPLAGTRDDGAPFLASVHVEGCAAAYIDTARQRGWEVSIMMSPESEGWFDLPLHLRKMGRSPVV